ARRTGDAVGGFVCFVECIVGGDIGCDVRREVIAERGAQNVVLNDCAGVGRASGAEAVVAVKEILAVPDAAPRQATSEGALRDVRRGKPNIFRSAQQFGVRQRVLGVGVDVAAAQ